ncbi:MAG: discoidin domain-containing protein [Myxococcales bacterium]|nr:discoidin domain-containing protein [Myxococcales bacterium]
MQVLAHEDDDFLFMNPDLRNAIAAGHGIVSVYLTAGQASGAPGMCAAELATARQDGMKAAYAVMAGYSPSATWTRDLFVPDPGVPWPHIAERYTLNANPRIRLIFLNIPDGGSQVGQCEYNPWTNALDRMFHNASYVTTTVVPDCGLAQGYPAKGGYCTADDPQHNGDSPGTLDNVDNGFICNSFTSCSPAVPFQNYDRAGLIAVLRGLLTQYQPIVIRTLDPQPFDPQSGSGDNLDHTATSRFLHEALTTYHGPNETSRYSLQHYVGYPYTPYPPNVGYGDSIYKRDVALTYAAHDPNYQAYADAYLPFYPRMYERYPTGTTWVEKAGDGRLFAVSVEDRQVKYWYETTPGGTWAGPATLATSGPVAPSVSLIKRPDGTLQIIAMRLPLERESWASLPIYTPRQEVITAVQDSGASTFGGWQTIGAPGPGTPQRVFGVPTASSTESAAYNVQYVQDGSFGTRWASAYGPTAWVTIDLGTVYPISRIRLQWEAAYGKNYALQASTDNTTWTNIVSAVNQNGGTDDYPNLNVSARYVRMLGTLRGLPAYGYSLYEFEIFAAETGQTNGVATAIYDGSGRMFVFARDKGGYLTVTSSTNGTTWSAWTRISSGDVLEGTGVVTRDDGIVEAYATSRSGTIQRFVENAGTGTFQQSALPLFVASSAPTVAKNQDGRVEIFYREVTSDTDNSRYGRVVTAWVNTLGQYVGGEGGGGILYGDAGTGPVAAIRRGGTGHIMLFERNYQGRVSATWQSSPNSSFVLQWDILGGPGEGQLMEEFPSATTDNLGRAVVLAKASDGRLYMKREASGLGTFGAWTQVGN